MNRLIKFQKDHCLAPDGILGPKTLRKMQTFFGISSEAKLAHFVGQLDHETLGFKVAEENLNYSPERLRVIFGNYFTYGESFDFAYNPEAIANRVYANRMGNGNEESGDGWKYRGRGAIQLTGKNNYEIFANKKRDLTILNSPGIVANRYYWDSALHYFTRNNIWYLASEMNNNAIENVTRAINGGTNGLQDRIEKTRKYYRMLCN